MFPQQPAGDPVVISPHLSPPFFSDLPAELQHIERRNFVGTQLEKAAEDANLEAILIFSRVSFCHDWSTLPTWKTSRNKKTIMVNKKHLRPTISKGATLDVDGC